MRRDDADRPPLQGHGDTELKKKILRGAFAVPEHVSDGARDLMKRMLTLKPDERTDLDGIRAHLWLSAYAESRGRAVGGGAADGRDDGRGRGADEGVMAFEAVGMEREKVEKAVRANSYTHEAACYEMLFSQGRIGPALGARAGVQPVQLAEPQPIQRNRWIGPRMDVWRPDRTSSPLWSRRSVGPTARMCGE